jgi:hypothetical protein
MAVKDQSISPSSGQWVTIQEASEITGKSENAISLLVRRRRMDRVKKVNGTGQGKWLIHRDSLVKYQSVNQSPDEVTKNDQSVNPVSQSVTDLLKSMIPLEHYEKKRSEWDQERDRLQAGMMMYRYKYEELDQQVKLLPAPVEAVCISLQNKEQALQDAREAITRLEEDLRQERKLPWWKKMFVKR